MNGKVGMQRAPTGGAGAKVWLLVWSLPLLAAWGQGPPQSPGAAGYAAVNETKLYYEMMGTGHPLVLIHGGAVDRRMWDDQFKVFAQHYKVIRYDQRGAGKSGIPMKRFSNTADLLGLLRFLKVDKTYLLGLSRGGGIAADFTLEHPDRVDGLVLTSSNLGGMPEAYRQMLAASFSAARDEGVARGVEVWLEDPYQAPSRDNKAARERFRGIVTENLVVNLFLLVGTKLVLPSEIPVSQRLSQIRVPTLVLSGERDHPDARANYDRAAKTIPHAQRAVVPDAAHLVNVDQPAEYNRIVLDFLSGLSKR